MSSKTGELIWRRSQKTPALNLLGASVPVLVGPAVIAGFDNGKIAAYQLSNGQPIWEITLTTPKGRTELDRIIDVDGKIKLLGSALFAATLNGSINGISLANNQFVWSKNFSTSTGINANPEGLYASDDKGSIWKMDPQNGNKLWKLDALQRYEPTLPALVGTSSLVIGDKKGNLHWINRSTGKFTARIKGDPRGYSVEPEVEGRTLYALGKSGVLSKVITP